MLISIDGNDGSGKSTAIRVLRKWLDFKGLGNHFHFTREPGGTKNGTKIRELLLHPPEGEGRSARVETMLFLADRLQNIEQSILPAVREGKTVITDRFIDTTFAYQVAGSGLDPADFEAMTEVALQGLVPDVTLTLLCDPDVGLRRVKERAGHTLDRYEQEELNFHVRVHEAYAYRAGYRVLGRNIEADASIAPTWPHDIVDGNQSRVDVAQAVIERVIEACYEADTMIADPGEIADIIDEMDEQDRRASEEETRISSLKAPTFEDIFSDAFGELPKDREVMASLEKVLNEVDDPKVLFNHLLSKRVQQDDLRSIFGVCVKRYTELHRAPDGMRYRRVKEKQCEPDEVLQYLVKSGKVDDPDAFARENLLIDLGVFFGCLEIPDIKE